MTFVDCESESTTKFSLTTIIVIKWKERENTNLYKIYMSTYPFWVNCIGTSMLCEEERRRSPAMSAKRAKSVSFGWSAKRGERRDSDKRTSSNFFTNSIDGCKKRKIYLLAKAILIKFLSVADSLLLSFASLLCFAL